MGWRTVVVNTHSKLSYKNNHLVFKDAYRTELIHLSEIDQIILETTDITLTTMLIKRLVDEQILVIFCDDKRLPKALLSPFYGRYNSSSQLKKQMFWADNLKDKVWIDIVKQKISNQAQFLSDLNDYERAERLREFSMNLTTKDPSNREAHAARLYFNGLFGNQFSRRTDSDLNASLNYGYTLLMSMFAREIVLNGCVTQLGLMHTNQFNEFNFASDLMEPFRVLVDEIVYYHREEEFPLVKRHLLDLFSQTYSYKNKNMYLTNIVSDYTKRVIKHLNADEERIPEFRI